MKKLIYLLCTLMMTVSCITLTTHAQDCKSGKLNPNVEGFLKRMPADNRSLEEMRKSTDFTEYRKGGPPAIPFPAKDILRIKITSDSIPVSILNPTAGKELPIIINYHPGGFIAPLTPGMEFLAWMDARTFNAIVFAVDYRVAPEHKFPAGMNDCYNAFKWISENGAKFGGDVNRIIVMGLSAGANLAAAVCQRAKKEGIANKIKLQILNSPVLDNPVNADSYPSFAENANGYMLTKAGVLFALETYADKKNHNDPEFAPIVAKDLSGLPPAVMITAEFDPLRDQGLAYAEKLRKAGVKVWNKCFAGEIHCLIPAAPDANSVKLANETILSAMSTVLNSK